MTGPFFKVTAAIFAVILLQNKSLCLQFSSSSPLLSNSVPPQTSRCSWSSVMTRALLHHFSLHNVGVLHLAIKQLFLSGTFWLLTITKHVSQRNAFPFTENHDIIKLTKLFWPESLVVAGFPFCKNFNVRVEPPTMISNYLARNLIPSNNAAGCRLCGEAEWALQSAVSDVWWSLSRRGKYLLRENQEKYTFSVWILFFFFW